MMNQRSEIAVPTGAEARVVCGIDGTAKAVPFHKTIYEIASEN